MMKLILLSLLDLDTLGARQFPSPNINPGKWCALNTMFCATIPKSYTSTANKRDYQFKRIKVKDLSGTYSAVMVRECKKIGEGWKPVKDHYGGRDDTNGAIWVGQSSHMAYSPYRIAGTNFPEGFKEIEGCWDRTCAWTHNANGGAALCNTGSGQGTHEWQSPTQANGIKEIICAKIVGINSKKTSGRQSCIECTRNADCKSDDKPICVKQKCQVRPEHKEDPDAMKPHVFTAPVWRSLTQTMLKGNATSSQCQSFNNFVASLKGEDASLIEVKSGSFLYSCKDPAAAKQIVNQIIRCKNKRLCNGITVRCDEQNWIVGRCGSSAEISVGSHGRGSLCTCKGNKVTYRPCTGNNNWGGVGASCDSPSQQQTIRVDKTSEILS